MLLNEIIENLSILLGLKKNKPNFINKNYSENKKYTSSPIEFHNKNIVYPSYKTEKEIENLYSEIREMQSQNKLKKERFKVSHDTH